MSSKRLGERARRARRRERRARANTRDERAVIDARRKMSDVATLERRARALRDELASRDAMLEAVQAQCKLDVESARAEREAANARADEERSMRLEAAAMAVCALEEKQRLEEELETMGETTRALERQLEAARAEAQTTEETTSTRERELEKKLEEVSERLARAEIGMRAVGSETPAPTPGRSPSEASFAKKVAMAEARARGNMEKQREELLQFLHRERRRGVERRVRGRDADAASSSDEDVYDEDEDEDAGEGTKKSAVEWGIERSKAYTAISELLQRLCDVLERANELATVTNADVLVSAEDDVDLTDDFPARSWATAASDLRDPDPTLERLVRWLENVDEAKTLDASSTLPELASRVSAAAHAVVFSLRRAVSAAATHESQTHEAYAIAEEAAEVYRLHLAQAESRASMAELRASAAEEAAETITELCADARRHADASAKLAESSRRELHRRETELALREITAASTNASSPSRASVADVLGERAPDRERARALAPFPSPI